MIGVLVLHDHISQLEYFPFVYRLAKPLLTMFLPCSSLRIVACLSLLHLLSCSSANLLLPAAAAVPGPITSSLPRSEWHCALTAATETRFLICPTTTAFSPSSDLLTHFFLFWGPATLTLLVTKASKSLCVAVKADLEIVVYPGILDRRKYLGLQKVFRIITQTLFDKRCRKILLHILP